MWCFWGIQCVCTLYHKIQYILNIEVYSNVAIVKWIMSNSPKILSQNLIQLKYESQNQIRLYIAIAKPDASKIPSENSMSLKYVSYNQIRLYNIPHKYTSWVFYHKTQCSWVFYHKTQCIEISITKYNAVEIWIAKSHELNATGQKEPVESPKRHALTPSLQ